MQAKQIRELVDRPSAGPLPVPPASIARFTLHQYHTMIKGGVFAEDERYELLDGWIVRKARRSPPHEFARHTLAHLITQTPPRESWVVRQQCGVTICESEPEPDLCVAAGPHSRYFDHHPGVAEIKLLVEVSDTELQHDREVKHRVYASALVPIYWIVNLVDRQIEVYTEPMQVDEHSVHRYRSRQDFRVGERVPIVLDGVAVGDVVVEDVLPNQSNP